MNSCPVHFQLNTLPKKSSGLFCRFVEVLLIATPSSMSLCLAYCTSTYYPELWILSLPPTKTSALCLGSAAQGSDLIPGRKLRFMRSRLVWFPVSMIRALRYLLLCAWKQLYLYLSSFIIVYSENLRWDDCHSFVTYSCNSIWNLNASSLLTWSQNFCLSVVRLKKSHIMALTLLG